MGERTNSDWLEALRGPEQGEALADLQRIVMRGLQHGLTGWPEVTNADREDFTQETLLKVLAELDSFRGESQFTTWVQKIAVRVALTELRHKRWQDTSLQSLLEQYEGSDATPAFMADDAPDTEHGAMQRMMMATIQRMIGEELTDKQRQAMMAVMQGGMPLQEVAERLGTNRNAMYKLLHDARWRLQQRMMKEGLTIDDVLSMFSTG